jgi:hypothetical protein
MPSRAARTQGTDRFSDPWRCRRGGPGSPSSDLRLPARKPVLRVPRLGARGARFAAPLVTLGRSIGLLAMAGRCGRRAPGQLSREVISDAACPSGGTLRGLLGLRTVDETRHLARQYASVLAQALFASPVAGAAIVKFVVTTPHPVRGFTHFAQRRLPTTWLPLWSPRRNLSGLDRGQRIWGDAYATDEPDDERNGTAGVGGQ